MSLILDDRQAFVFLKTVGVLDFNYQKANQDSRKNEKIQRIVCFDMVDSLPPI